MFTDSTNLLDRKQGYCIIDESYKKSAEVHLYIDVTNYYDLAVRLTRQFRSNVVPTIWIATGIPFTDYDGNHTYRCGINPSKIHIDKITDKQLDITFYLDKEREYYDAVHDFLLYENWKPVITMSNIIYSISLEKCSQTTVK